MPEPRADSIPPYDPGRRCPKCGHDDIGTTFHADLHAIGCVGECRFERFSDECRSWPHMDRGCRRCGFKWMEAAGDEPLVTRADHIAAYETKVEEFAAETLRSGAWRDACRWAVNGLSREDVRTIRGGQPWAPPDVLPLLIEAMDAGLPEPDNGREAADGR